ncbi:MAG: competence protein ComK [Holdemanella porci]
MNYLYYEYKSSTVCTVKEDEKLYYKSLSTQNYLNEKCLLNGSTLKGRQEAFVYQMKVKKYIPVVVSISRKEIYFPNKSKKHMTVSGSIMPILKTSLTLSPLAQSHFMMVPNSIVSIPNEFNKR